MHDDMHDDMHDMHLVHQVL